MLTYKDQRAAYVLVCVFLVVLTGYVMIRTWNARIEQKYIGKPESIRDTISISGEGKVTAKPTLALVQFGVVSQASTPLKAQTDNTSKMNEVHRAMKELGIKEEDLATSGYSLFPGYDYSQNPPKIVNYSVSQQLSIKIRDFSKVGTVLERGVALGINQVNSVQFTIDDPSQLREQAREKALEDAKKKANALAKVLGVEMVRVVSFTENTGGGGPIMPMYDSMMGRAEAAPAPSIEPGTQDVQMFVTVTYEIR